MPQSAQDVQRFLGLANYYCRFIKSFATIGKPLHRLTEKGVVFSWTPECKNSFNLLKTQLTSAPTLTGHVHSFSAWMPVTLALELCFLSCKKTEVSVLWYMLAEF